MITTKREYQLFTALVNELEKMIQGEVCDHPVNLCVCDLRSLLAQSRAIVVKHARQPWLDKSFPFTMPNKKGPA